MPKHLADYDSVHEYEKHRARGVNTGLVASPVSIPQRRDVKRSQKWDKMLTRWAEYTTSKTHKVKRRCRKGIPDKHRRAAWNTLIQVHKHLAQFPTLYQSLSQPQEGGGEKGQGMKEGGEDEEGVVAVVEGTGSEHGNNSFQAGGTLAVAAGGLESEELSGVYRDIEMDLHRTFPEHRAFAQGTEEGERGVGRLRRVLRAYADFDEELGYCQALNFVAGTLLLYLPEHEAFWHLVTLMQRADAPLRGLYLPDMAFTKVVLGTLDELMKTHLPALASHFEKEGVVSAMFATGWYMTLFSRDFPLSLTARVLDCFYAEGTFKVVHRVVLALLQSVEGSLLKGDLGDINTIVRGLPEKIEAGEVEVDDVMLRAFKFELKAAHITEIASKLPVEN